MKIFMQCARSIMQADSANWYILKVNIITTVLKQIDSYKGWRIGGPPQWYPTHSNAYYIGVTRGSFTEVSCLGMPSWMESFNRDDQPL